MEKNSKGIKNIIVDTNIIFSSLVKQEGYTQAVLSLICNTDFDLIIPSKVVREINRHIYEITRKSGVPQKIIKHLLNLILKNFKIIKEERMKKEIIKGFSYVKHKEDAVFVGTAMKYSPSIILTYNKKHFFVEKLKKENVMVFKPKELINYLNLELETTKNVKRKRGLIRIVSKFLLKDRASG
jgi:predicted nucleic acid-binding protein